MAMKGAVSTAWSVKGPSPPSHGNMSDYLHQHVHVGDMITISRKWSGSSHVWITAGHPDTPCLKRHLIVLVRTTLSDDDLKLFGQAVFDRVTPKAMVSVVLPWQQQEEIDDDDQYEGEDVLKHLRMDNVDMFTTHYWRPGQVPNTVIWCRHCLSGANKAFLLGKIPDTDCARSGRDHTCVRGQELRQALQQGKAGCSAPSYGCSSLKRAMRTAALLTGAAATEDEVMSCGSKTEEHRIRIYPELKELTNSVEIHLTWLMYTQSTTSAKKIQQDALRIGGEYEGIGYELPEYDSHLRGLVDRNVPQYSYFLQRTDHPPCMVIVSHGQFLAQYVLGRYG